MEDGTRCSAPADIGISQSLLPTESPASIGDGIYQQKDIMDALRIHAKNGRINLDARLILLFWELSMITWDIVCFSETRLETRDEFIEGSPRLISSNDKNARIQAINIAILIHRRWIGQINKKICFHDRVMTIDFKFLRRMIRVFVVYLSNAWNY